MNRIESNRRAGRPLPHQDGFTLIEIMVVIVILGLLATLVVPNVMGMGEDAKIAKAQTDVKSIYEQGKLFAIRNSRIPTLEDLVTPDEKGKTYIENPGPDPWDNEYVIRELENRRFEVISFGPDGSEGTEDDISSTPKPKER